MFGLTRREQRWKADREAAELLVSLATSVIQATAQVEVARAQASESDEVARLREEVAGLRRQLTATTQEG